MSRENVEIIRETIDMFNRRDLEALGNACDDDFEFVSVFAAVDAGEVTFRGPNAWPDYFALMDESWTDLTVKDVHLVEAGPDLIASRVRLVGTGRSSGIPVDTTIGFTHRLREGKLWRLHAFADPAEALAAVGLSE